MNFWGVSGFGNQDELKRLVMKPDAVGSAINSLNGCYVLGVSLLDSVRMTLGPEELKVLKAEVTLVFAEVFPLCSHAGK